SIRAADDEHLVRGPLSDNQHAGGFGDRRDGDGGGPPSMVKAHPLWRMGFGCLLSAPANAGGSSDVTSSLPPLIPLPSSARTLCERPPLTVPSRMVSGCNRRPLDTLHTPCAGFLRWR